MKTPSEHTLDTIWGHDSIRELMRSVIIRKRLPHAFLLHGPDGVGKRSLAFAMAKQILSSGRPPSEQTIDNPSADFLVNLPTDLEKPDDDMFGGDMFGDEVDMFGGIEDETEPESEVEQPEPDPAEDDIFGETLVESASSQIPVIDDDYDPHLHLHPRVNDQVSRSYPLEYDGDIPLPAKCIDLNIIEPVGKSKSIKVDQVRYLQDAAWVSPMEGRYRVILVFGADTITGSAANSLLKFLEEPPSFLILILVTNQYHRVIDTIRSRCVSLFCQPMRLSLLTERLIQEEKVEQGLARIAAAFAEGRVGLALSSLSGKALKQRQEILDARLGIERIGLHTLPDAVHRCLENSDKPGEALLILLSLIRDRMVHQIGPRQENLIVNHDFMDQIGDLEKDLDSLMAEANRLAEMMEMDDHPAVPAPQLPLEIALWPRD